MGPVECPPCPHGAGRRHPGRASSDRRSQHASLAKTGQPGDDVPPGEPAIWGILLADEEAKVSVNTVVNRQPERLADMWRRMGAATSGLRLRPIPKTTTTEPLRSMGQVFDLASLPRIKTREQRSWKRAVHSPVGEVGVSICAGQPIARSRGGQPGPLGQGCRRTGLPPKNVGW